MIATAAAVAAMTAGAWSAPAAVPGSTTAFPFPLTAAIGTDGTAAVAWRAGGDRPATARVRVAVRDPGRGWSTSTLSGDRAGVTGPRVAVDGRGRVVVVWVSMHRRRDLATHGPFRVRVVMRDRHRRWQPARTLGRSTAFTYALPDVAVDARGDAVVVWRGSHRRGDGSRRSAVIAAARARGGAFGRPVALRDAGDGPRVAPRVAIDAHGRAVAVWTAGVAARVRYATAHAGTWSRGRDLGQSPGSAPVVAMDTAGAATVAWRQAALDSEGNGTQFGAVAVAQRPAGGPFGIPVTVGVLPSPGPLVAMSPAGRALVAWSLAPTDLPVPSALDYAVAAAGQPFGAPATVPGPSAVGLAMLGDGTGLVASAGDGITVRALPPGAPPREPVRIARAGSEPRIAAAGRHAIVVWLGGGRLRYAVR